MTDSVANKLTDLTIKSSEARNNLNSSPPSNNNQDDKNNPWKTSNHKTLEKTVLGNELWPNLKAQAENKNDNSRRNDDKQQKKNFNKWGHLEVETNKPSNTGNGRGRFSGPAQSSPNSYNPINNATRPRRGNNYVVRMRGRNTRSQGRPRLDHHEDHTSQQQEVESSKKESREDGKRTDNSETKPNDDESEGNNRRSNPLPNNNKDTMVKKSQEDVGNSIHRGVNIISNQNVIPNTFFSTGAGPITRPSIYQQLIPMPDMYYGQIPSDSVVKNILADSVANLVETPPVIDADELIKICKEYGWGKVVFPRALRESKILADKIPKDLPDNEIKQNGEPIIGNVVVIVDKKLYIVPKFKFHTTFLKFNSKNDYIRHHLNHYFSDRNLRSDSHLISIINENNNTCPISEILQFSRLKSIGTTESELQEAAKFLNIIQISVGQDNKPVIVPLALNKEINDQVTLAQTLSGANNAQLNLGFDISSQNTNSEEMNYPPNVDQLQPVLPCPQATNNFANPGQVMFSFLPTNQGGPTGYLQNQNSNYLQQNAQIQSSVATNMNAAVSTSAPFFPYIQNYLPFYQPTATHSNPNANIIQQPNHANVQQTNSSQNSSASQQQQQVNPQPGQIIVGGNYFQPTNQPPFQVFTALSQPNQHFFNQSFTNTNPSHTVSNIQGHANFNRFPQLASLHPAAAASNQQISNQNMLFHFINPHGAIPGQQIGNVFHPVQQENVHALLNRNAAMMNPNQSIIMPITGQHPSMGPGHHVISGPNYHQVLSTNPPPPPQPSQDSNVGANRMNSASSGSNSNSSTSTTNNNNSQHMIYPPSNSNNQPQNSRKSPSVQKKLENFSESTVHLSSSNQNQNDSFPKD